MEREFTTSDVNRRAVLTGIGGASVPLTFGTVTARQENLPVVIHRRGSWDRPLNVEQMMTVKRSAIKQHVQRGGNAPGEFLDAVPGYPDHAKLVDYVVGVKPDGQPVQHVGVAGSRESVGAVHRDADEKVLEVQRKARGEKA
jgi:hypothetical protein